MKILNVVGARPNLMKMAPLVAELPELWDGHAAERIVEVLLKSRSMAK